MTDVQEFLDRDRAENPGCTYSTQQSTSCRCVNGDTKCELIKRILRRCPGEQQHKEVFSVREETEGDGVSMGGSMGGSIGSFNFGFSGSHGNGGPSDGMPQHPFGGMFMNPFQMLDEMLRGEGFPNSDGHMGQYSQQHQQQRQGMAEEPELAPAPHLSPRGQYRDPRANSSNSSSSSYGSNTPDAQQEFDRRATDNSWW